MDKKAGKARGVSPKNFIDGKHTYVFFRPDNAAAAKWAPRVSAWLAKNGAKVAKSGAQADLVFALGGDGTILEAARAYGQNGASIVGLNMGTVGFLAAVREPKNFLSGLARLAAGKGRFIERMAATATVVRDGQPVFSANALNEIAVQHLLGVVELDVSIDGHPVQSVRGNGFLVATATGSTAYNLSAHGPIVAPEIRCLVLTELLDHSIPSPSVIVPPSHEVELRVRGFREHRLLAKAGGDTGPIDVIMTADGDQIFPLRRGDVIRVTAAPQSVTFVELEPHYFFKSLSEKFRFR